MSQSVFVVPVPQRGHIPELTFDREANIVCIQKSAWDKGSRSYGRGQDTMLVMLCARVGTVLEPSLPPTPIALPPLSQLPQHLRE